MAHFLYPMRPATKQEGDAFAFPQEQGIMKTHHDVWSVGIGAHLVAKCPFSVGDLLCMQNEEFVVTERHKQQNKFTIKLIRDPRITMEATCEELDTHFYLCPGQEMPVNNAEAKKLLGRAPKAEESEGKKKDKDKDKDKD